MIGGFLFLNFLLGRKYNLVVMKMDFRIRQTWFLAIFCPLRDLSPEFHNL